jgi:hypothetical protein
MKPKTLHNESFKKSPEESKTIKNGTMINSRLATDGS